MQTIASILNRTDSTDRWATAILLGEKVAVRADDLQKIIISIPVDYIDDNASNGYHPDTEALWERLQIELLNLGYTFTGDAGVEEGGAGEWMVFAR